jgi:hypothetical protein
LLDTPFVGLGLTVDDRFRSPGPGLLGVSAVALRGTVSPVSVAVKRLVDADLQAPTTQKAQLMDRGWPAGVGWSVEGVAALPARRRDGNG